MILMSRDEPPPAVLEPLQVSNDLLDDRVGAVSVLDFQHDQWGVGEHPVVVVRRKQFALALRDRLGVETFDPAHDQPGADVVDFGPRRERREGDFGYFGVGDQALFVFIPDRPLSAISRSLREGVWV